MPPEPLQYHAPGVLAEVQTTHRRPLLLLIPLVFVPFGVALVVANAAGWAKAPNQPAVRVAVYAFAALFVGLGLAPLASYILDLAPRVRFTTEGVAVGRNRLRPWRKIARVGGTLRRDGVELEMTYAHGTDPWPRFMGNAALYTRPRYTEAEFHAFMDRLEAGSAYFPDVWLDRVLEPPDYHEGRVTRRVADELLRRSGQR